jgi:glycerophosphoryl diester phosphodiesterase
MEAVMEPTEADGRRSFVIAAGGASASAPPYTIAALEMALAEGADALGLKVRLSRDGHPVVFGDAALQRGTNGRGPVSAHSVRELKRLDAGEGQRIQTLEEVLERFRDRTHFWIELPAEGEASPASEERLVSTLEIYDAVDRTGVWTSDEAAIGRLRALNQTLRLGLVKSHLPRVIPMGEALPILCRPAAVLTEQGLETIRKAGSSCYADATDELALVDRLVGWRVDGIITDRPGTVRSRLDRGGRLD